MKKIGFALLAVAALTAPASSQSYGDSRLTVSTASAGTVTTVGTTAVLIAPARQYRAQLYVSILAANNCYFSGSSAVAVGSGFKLQAVAGASFRSVSSGAMYAICDASTTVSVLDEY